MAEQTHKNVLYVKCKKRKMRSSFSSFGIPNLPSALSLSLPPFHPGRASEGIGISNQDAGGGGGRICGIGKGGECRG